jgi:hypothetical protein
MYGRDWKLKQHKHGIRPKLRWEDDMIQDIKTLGVKNWRNVAMDKESWQKILRKARAHVGLSCLADDDDDDTTSSN